MEMFPYHLNYLMETATDDTTHIPNWNALREFLGESDFIYIADCKLCSQKSLNHIHEHGGIFITIVPQNRSVCQKVLRVSKNKRHRMAICL